MCVLQRPLSGLSLRFMATPYDTGLMRSVFQPIALIRYHEHWSDHQGVRLSPEGVALCGSVSNPLGPWAFPAIFSRAQRPLATSLLQVRDEDAAGLNPVTPTSVPAGRRPYPVPGGAFGLLLSDLVDTLTPSASVRLPATRGQGPTSRPRPRPPNAQPESAAVSCSGVPTSCETGVFRGFETSMCRIVRGVPQLAGSGECRLKLVPKEPQRSLLAAQPGRGRIC